MIDGASERMGVNTRENTIKAIKYDNPEWVPVFDGTVWESVQLGGNFKYESWTDDWGTVWQVSHEGLVPTDVVHPLSDIRNIDNYDWPDPWNLTWTEEDQRQLESVDSERTLVGGLHIKFVCERLCCVMGMENFMLAMYEEPDRLQELIDRIVDYNIVCFQRLIDLGVNILHVSEDLGTQNALMMSPDMFRKFILPAYEKCFAEPLARRIIIDFHTCGHVEEIIPDLVAVGVGIINPMQAAANDQHIAKDMVRGKTAILGGINSTVMLTGTLDEVRQEVRRAFDVLKPGGGWLAGPDQVINGAPEDNVKALWETCWELSPYGGNGLS